MNNITAVIIAKNEQDVIEECLQSLNFVDKILVIDCYSTDKTAQIAEKNDASVLKVKFQDFSQIRNFALQHVKTKWVLYVDSDERISEQLKDNILQIVKTDAATVSYKRKNYYLGKPWPYLETLIRLFQTDKIKKWSGVIHESPEYLGRPVFIKGHLLHYTHRDISQMLVKTINWSDVEAQIRFNNNHPQVYWWRLIRVYLTGFFNSYIREQGIRVGSVGLIESLYQGFSMYITYLKLWELQKNAKK